MGVVIDKCTTNMDLATYSAIQTMKSSLKTSDKTSVEYFGETSPPRDLMDRLLVKPTLTAVQVEKQRMIYASIDHQMVAEALGLPPQKLTTKRKSVYDLLDQAKQARLEHVTSLESSEKPEKRGGNANLLNQWKENASYYETGSRESETQIMQSIKVS